MRFLVDECVGRRVANWLRSKGHHAMDVLSSYLKGSDDISLLNLAAMEKMVVITRDQDLADHIFRDGMENYGLILFKEGRWTSKMMMGHLLNLLQ